MTFFCPPRITELHFLVRSFLLPLVFLSPFFCLLTSVRYLRFYSVLVYVLTILDDNSLFFYPKFE